MITKIKKLKKSFGKSSPQKLKKKASWCPATLSSQGLIGKKTCKKLYLESQNT